MVSMREIINTVGAALLEGVEITPELLKAVRGRLRHICPDCDAQHADDPTLTKLVQRVLHRINEEEPIAPVMTVVRAELRPLEGLDTMTSAGAHWCWDGNLARVYHDQNAWEQWAEDGYEKEDLSEVIIVAEVRFEDIDWPFTIATNIVLPQEAEITIKPGSHVEIVDMTSNGKTFRVTHPVEIDGYYNE